MRFREVCSETLYDRVAASTLLKDRRLVFWKDGVWAEGLLGPDRYWATLGILIFKS